MSENLETIKTENEDYDGIEANDYADVNDGSGKVIGLTLAIVTGVAALGVAAFKKLKAKANDKPEKKRKKLMWIEVEDGKNDSDEVEVETKEVDEEETEK